MHIRYAQHQDIKVNGGQPLGPPNLLFGQDGRSMLWYTADNSVAIVPMHVLRNADHCQPVALDDFGTSVERELLSRSKAGAEQVQVHRIDVRDAPFQYVFNQGSDVLGATSVRFNNADMAALVEQVNAQLNPAHAPSQHDIAGAEPANTTTQDADVDATPDNTPGGMTR